MVAGLAAGDQAWVKFFGWVVKERPVEEWCSVQGLPDALACAFNSDHPDRMTSPMEEVLGWLLVREEGRLLLGDNAATSAAVSGWLQRHACSRNVSPLMVLFGQRTVGAAAAHGMADALSWLLGSPELCKGAVVSLLACRGRPSDGWGYQGELVGRLVGRQLQQQVVDTGLLNILLQAAACDSGDQRRAMAMRALVQLPNERLLPLLIQLLGEGPAQAPAPSADGPLCAGGGQQPAAGSGGAGTAGAASGPSRITAAAAGGGSLATPDAVDTQVLVGAWVALEQIRASSEQGQQQVLETMHQLVKDAGRVRELQQVQAAGHATWVAAAQAHRELEAKQHLLQQEQAALTAQQQQLEQREASMAAQQLLLQQEREALAAERQQLQQAETEVHRQRKRRQL
jgi:hypothetical protein